MSTHKSTLPGITTEQLARAGQPLEQAYTLPPAAYTDPDVYAREVTAIMRTSWLPLARVDQIPNPGDYLSLDLFGQPIMVVHGTDGEIRTMSRVCLHRAAPVAEGSGQRKLFTCPYHAWSYDTAGELVRAPLMEGADGFDKMGATKKDCRLPQIKTEIWEGFIMANLDDNAAPLAPQIKGYTEFFAPYRLADMAVAKTLEFPCDWNWKVLVENFMEAYHHIATHSATLEPVFHAKDSKIPDNNGEPWSILHMPAADQSAPHPEGTMDGLNDGQAHDLLATVIFPHFLMGIQGHSFVWYQVLPEAHDKLTLKIHVCLPRSSIPADKWDETGEVGAALVSVIHHEDIEANDMVWRGLTAPLTTQGRLSPLEKSIWQMNQWWLGKMTDAEA